MKPCLFCQSPMPTYKACCPHCGKWQDAADPQDNWELVRLKDVKEAPKERLQTGPWDYVFNGGLVKTSTGILGGTPGAGKSTLLLQICDGCPSDENNAPLYIAAEEDLSEIKTRADRLKVTNQNIGLVPAMNGANVGKILESVTPSLVIIDSLQGMAGDDDKLQAEICRIAKQHAVRLKCPVILISHVTKQEVLAGKMGLQHAVDGTFLLYLEDNIRVLTATKNRNGPAFRESHFEMLENGLVHLEDKDGHS